MSENSSYPPEFGPQPQPAGNHSAYPQPADRPPAAAPMRPRLGLLASGVVLGVLLSVAALVLSIITAMRGPEATASPAAPQIQPQQLFVDDADKALCEAIGPLMQEETARGRAFLNSGEPDSPARKAAIPQFKAETRQWADRIQALLNDHADPPRYLTRTLQQYVDAMLLYSENLRDDRAPDPYDNIAYEAAIVAVGGPLVTCYNVGAGW